MKIDDLIAVLKRARESKGNIEVACGSFCGTNNGHVCFHIKPIRHNFSVANHTNGLGEFVLAIEVSPTSEKDILNGRKQMKELGYDFIPSQFRGIGEQIQRNPPEFLTFCPS